MSECVEILLVEDNPNDIELALHALQKNHLANRVHVAHDGVEALEFVFSALEPGCRPKVILLDLKLPRMDGHEVLRRLRSDPRTVHTPVVVLTSSREERDMEKSYDLGANSYIVKPVDWVQFTSAVQEIGMYWAVLNQPPLGEPRPFAEATR